jgi:hypothetical protein
MESGDGPLTCIGHRVRLELQGLIPPRLGGRTGRPYKLRVDTLQAADALGIKLEEPVGGTVGTTLVRFYPWSGVRQPRSC